MEVCYNFKYKTLETRNLYSHINDTPLFMIMEKFGIVKFVSDYTTTDVHVQKQFLVNWLKAKKWHKSISQTHITCVLFILPEFLCGKCTYEPSSCTYFWKLSHIIGTSVAYIGCYVLSSYVSEGSICSILFWHTRGMVGSSNDL